MYFETAAKEGPCRRSLMLHYETPTLLRHGDVWIFHFPSWRQVTIRGPRNNVWVTYSNTFRRRVDSEHHDLLNHFRRDANPTWTTRRHTCKPRPSVRVRTRGLSDINKTRAPRVEAALTADVNERDQLTDRLATSQKSLEVDTLLYIQKATFSQETLPHWHLILAASSCIFTILLVLYLSLRSKLHCSTSCCLRTNKSPEDATPQSSTSPAPTSDHRQPPFIQTNVATSLRYVCTAMQKLDS